MREQTQVAMVLKQAQILQSDTKELGQMVYKMVMVAKHTRTVAFIRVKCVVV